ncbi:MAG: type II toxin-antitoxin system prevent-host-death family antitoxin [Betaproteobacteria bacterium]|nr:type II toxin-antitoxin system prevent-host-death family antitoxin [Betaproteobacteria bacterium]
MSEIGAYEAKTHLPKLLARVEKGESFVITRHGRAVAELTPMGKQDEKSIRRAIADLRSLRDELAGRGVHMRDLLGKGESVRDLAHKGHRN